MKVSMHNWMRPEPIQATIERLARLGYDGLEISGEPQGFDAEQVRWGNYLLKALAGTYDFVAPHYYCAADVHKLPFEDLDLLVGPNFRRTFYLHQST